MAKARKLVAERAAAHVDPVHVGVQWVMPGDAYVPANDRVIIPHAFRPLHEAVTRYLVAHGGRGSGKSWYYATKLVLAHLEDPGMRSICVREVQKSLSQSVKKLIEDVIVRLGAQPYFRILNTHIETKGGGRIDFFGLQSHTADTIKSHEGAKVCWIEEAQTISKKSLRILRPTIRAEGSQLWFSYNPMYADDPVDDLFRGEKPPSSLTVVEANWEDNPFISSALLEEKDEDYNRDAGLADHVWGGNYLSRSEASVFTRWSVEDFETPQWHERKKYRSAVMGMDFGFSIDPAAVVLMYVDDTERKIYISHEGYKKGLEVDHYPKFVDDSIPEEFHKRAIVCDNARPEIISYLKKRGYAAKPCKKGAGSIVEGVKFLQSYEIVVHPRCIWVQRELARYSYKVDPKTEEILNELEDKDNHLIDAMRYATERLRRGGSILDNL